MLRDARLRLALIGCLASLALGCRSFSTSYDFDPSAEFKALERYDWIDVAVDAQPESLAHARAVHAIDQVLALRGYVLDSESPDFRVAAHLGSERRVHVTDFGYGFDHRYGWIGPRHLDVREYESDTLVVDVVLVATGELIWRGSARGTIDKGADPTERAAHMQRVVEQVLASFPPGATPAGS